MCVLGEKIKNGRRTRVSNNENVLSVLTQMKYKITHFDVVYHRVYFYDVIIFLFNILLLRL